jgi:hypothetical protein
MADIMEIAARVRENGVEMIPEKELRMAVEAGRLGEHVGDRIKSRLESQFVKFGSAFSRNQDNYVALYDARSDGKVLCLKEALDLLLEGKAELPEVTTIYSAIKAAFPPKRIDT